jgi:hypothetical protein
MAPNTNYQSKRPRHASRNGDTHVFVMITESHTHINSEVVLNTVAAEVGITHRVAKGAAWVDAVAVEPVPAVPGVEPRPFAVAILALRPLRQKPPTQATISKSINGGSTYYHSPAERRRGNPTNRRI